MNYIVFGTDNLRPLGMIFGFAGIAVVIASWICRSLHFLEVSASTTTHPKSHFPADTPRYSESILAKRAV